MRILVTGGCGFIGSNFIRLVLGRYQDYSIINLDKLTYAGTTANPGPDVDSDSRYRFVKGDICDPVLVDELVGQVDAVVHFAAETHVDRSIINPGEFVMTNVVGTQILLDACLRHGGVRFHHISTDEVFGELGETGRFTEETPYSPRSPYSASKAAADHLVRAFFYTHGMHVTISNCSNNYGPRQFPEKLLPLFITNLLEGKKVPVYGKGLNVRDWIYVDDHNEGVLKILHEGRAGETYCLGGASEKRNIDITTMILEAFGKGFEMVEYVTDRKGHDFRYAIDFTKINNDLGWSPTRSFDQGLEETIAWYRENPGWWEPLKRRTIDRITDKQK